MHYLVLISLLLISFLGLSQTEVAWEDLKLDSTSEVWSEEHQSVYLNPHFSDKVKLLKGTDIKITGYLIPVDVGSEYYILSEVKYTDHFFYHTEQDQILELTLNGDYQMNLEITVTGTLIINQDDLSKLCYIIEDAKIVEK
ncbi:MAG: hypothetical protein ACI8Q1_001870 [Parvicella sp.]|jgi:hypothetical protein